MKFCYIEDWRTYWNIREAGQAVLAQSLPVCPVCLADSLSRLCESDVVPVVLAALLQHVSGPRQPLEDAGSLPHRHLLYPLMQHHKRDALIWAAGKIRSGFNQLQEFFQTFQKSFSWHDSSGSNESHRLPGQCPAEAAGGRALRRGDCGHHQPGVHPHPGGADRAGGTTEEEGPAGGCVCGCTWERGGGQEAETGELILWLWWSSGDPQLDRPPAQREEQPGAGNENLRDDQQVTCTFFFL